MGVDYIDNQLEENAIARVDKSGKLSAWMRDMCQDGRDTLDLLFFVAIFIS